jgi:uncharacterized membrane-anchored protein
VFSRTSSVAAFAAVALVACQAATAQEPEGESAPPVSLRYQTGQIVLPNKVATLKLDSYYRYLDPKETEKLLVAWGNPPEAVSGTEGAVVPAEVDPFGENGWAVVLSYVDDGHVDDADAREIDYDKLLSEMQQSTEASNEARESAGFGTVKLVGWASKPQYDSVAHKMVWAKELDFGGKEHTLNYDVRVLGREGVLSMNAVGSMSQISGIRQDMQSLLKLAEFNEGHRYDQYNASTDKLAAYGLGALVAGGVAAKLGLFAKLFAFLLAFKKIFIVGGIAAIGLIGKLLKGRSKDAPAG